MQGSLVTTEPHQEEGTRAAWETKPGKEWPQTHHRRLYDCKEPRK